MELFDKIGDSLSDIGKSVKKTVKKVGEAVTDTGKKLADGVSDFVTNIPRRVKLGFEGVGEVAELTAKQFKNGAWLAGIGSSLLTVGSVATAAVNTVTGGAFMGIGESIVDTMNLDTDENGNLRMNIDEDASFGEKAVASIFGTPALQMANTEFEIDEAIDEGDIKKANNYGGKLLLTQAKVAGSAAATAVTFGGASMAAIVGANAGSYVLDKVNDYSMLDAECENIVDGVSDRADELVSEFCDKGYIDIKDTNSVNLVKLAAIDYLNSANNASEEDFKRLLVMYKGQNGLNISVDYFKDRYRNVDEIKALYIEGDDASKEYQEKIIDALGKRDGLFISYDECDRMTAQANYEYSYAESIKNGDMTKEQAVKYAELDVAYEFGDIDNTQYVKQQTMISLDNIAFTDAQKDAYTDYIIALSEGDITEQEMIDMLYEDPDFTMCFDENGAFMLPKIEKSEINNIEMVSAEIPNVDILNSQMSKNEIAAEWFSSYGSGANAFMETMYSKLLTTPILGKALAEKQVETMQKLGLQSSIIDLDNKSLSKEQLAEQLVEKAETILEDKGITQSISDIDMQFAGI